MINTDALREHYNAPAFTGPATPDIEALCDEVDRHRARLAEVLALCDEARSGAFDSRISFESAVRAAARGEGDPTT